MVFRRWVAGLALLGASVVVGCGGVTLKSPDGDAGTGGASGSPGAGGAAGDAGVDATTSADVPVDVLADAPVEASVEASSDADARLDEGADGGSADVGLDVTEPDAAAGGADASPGDADGGADVSAAGDGPPKCDAGSTLDGGACVPIVVVIGSTAPCAGGGDVIFLDGDADNYVFHGQQTVTLGQWSTTSSSTEVHVHVVPTDTAQGFWWDLYFDSSQLQMSLAPQVYTDAQRWPFETAGHPGLDVSGDGRGCNTVAGRFQIEDLTTASGALKSFTATFEHHCEGGASALRGCVHVEM